MMYADMMIPWWPWWYSKPWWLPQPGRSLGAAFGWCATFTATGLPIDHWQSSCEPTCECLDVPWIWMSWKQNIWISYPFMTLHDVFFVIWHVNFRRIFLGILEILSKTWSHGAGSKSKVGSKIRKYDLGFGPSNCWLPGSLQLQHFLSRALEKMDPLEISYDSMWSHGVSYGNGDPNSGFNGDPGTSV